jgi:hypothetical protein
MNIETLVFIFILVETIQMAGILYNTHKTNKLIDGLMNDPAVGGKVLSEGIHGFIEALQSDPKKQEYFFGLMASIGNAAVQGIRGKGGVAPKPVKLSGWMKLFEPFINNPDVQGMVADKVAGFVAKTGEAGAEQAVSGWQ